MSKPLAKGFAVRLIGKNGERFPLKIYSALSTLIAIPQGPEPTGYLEESGEIEQISRPRDRTFYREGLDYDYPKRRSVHIYRER